MPSSSWQRLGVVVPGSQKEVVSRLLMDLGSLGIEETLTGGRPFPIRQLWDPQQEFPTETTTQLVAYFALDGGERQRLDTLRSAYPQLTWAENRVSEGDWDELWRTDFAPFRVHSFPDAPLRRALLVAPPWQATATSLIIEPGMAFGTGQHLSTRFCLRAILSHGHSGERLLDVGCGSGILALAATKLGMHAYGVDNDPVAVGAAIQNAARNNLSCPFDTRTPASLTGPWDLVVANIHAEALVELAPHLTRLCGRLLILSGILADRQARVLAAFEALALQARHQVDEWISLEYRQP